MSPKRVTAPVNSVLSIIMGGGRGARLFPLTRDRAKPAVPLAGKYRLVDIPISNCINSGLKRIYLLTQFNSASLHRHISQSYKFDHFTGGFVEVLAAEQTFASASWYQGTADAVRKNLVHFLTHDFDYALILSGDQLYRMDFREILARHIETEADLTISVMPAGRGAAPSLGVMQINEQGRIVRFVEKPKSPELLAEMKLASEWLERFHLAPGTDWYLASMGIYVFNRQALLGLLENNLPDFGKNIIPAAIEERHLQSFVFQGYWEDIGTIRTFFEANLDAAAERPRFNFYDLRAPIFTRPRFLPASKINGADISFAIVSDGCILNRAVISNSIIGIRSLVGKGSKLNRVVLMGCDYYESEESIRENERAGRPRIGIGEHTVIENAIIDKNARIGNHCVLTPSGKPEAMDHPLYYIRDGILIVPKGGVIQDGTVV